MQLFILRHGQAEAQRTTDEARNLTLQGRRDVAASAAASLADLQQVQKVWVSPLVRAQQTAKIVCDEMERIAVNFSLHTTDLIVPEANPQDLFNALQKEGGEAILLVSHQPLVGQFIDLFCGSYTGFHEMNTSSLACIDYEVAAKNMGTLRWLRHSHG
ncbi:MAG TPA: phosphohistidine phosphatase SixA [Cellvibrio sp.]|nr:phosphohistidine phosphatase SixA [Cellvibrio sp.]